MTPFFTINNISISVKRSNFTLVFFKAACHPNSGAVKKQGESKVRKFSNASAHNNVPL